MSTEKSKEMCKGCRDDYYNQPGNSATGECWMYQQAEVVTRYRIGWWVRPDTPGAFTKVQTLNCHSEPGQFGFYEQLPECAKVKASTA